MSYRTSNDGSLEVAWVNAWRDRGVITGCFGHPPREVMLKDLRTMGAADFAPPNISARPWWQTWGVIGVLALTVGLLLWQPTMKRNPRRRRLLRNTSTRRARENACGRSKDGHDYQYSGQYGKDGRTVVTFTCTKCQKKRERYNDSRSWMKKNRTSRLRRNSKCKHDYVSTGTWVRPSGSSKDYLISKCSKCGKRKRQTEAQQYAFAKAQQRLRGLRSLKKNRTSRLRRNSKWSKTIPPCVKPARKDRSGHGWVGYGVVQSCFYCKTKRKFIKGVPYYQGSLRPNSVKRDIADLISKAQSAGWIVEKTKSGHIRFKPSDPSKPIVIVGSTPSDHRALKNIKSMLRRSGLAVNPKVRTRPCEPCKGSGDAPGTWPIEACASCDGSGKRPETSEERFKREKRNARGRARSDAMRSVGMRKSRYGGWE